MSAPDFWSADFLSPLDGEFGPMQLPSTGEPTDLTPASDRAPARVLFEVQDELWELSQKLEHERVLKGREREEFLEDLERTYRKLQRYLRDRSQR